MIVYGTTQQTVLFRVTCALKCMRLDDVNTVIQYQVHTHVQIVNNYDYAFMWLVDLCLCVYLSH